WAGAKEDNNTNILANKVSRVLRENCAILPPDQSTFSIISCTGFKPHIGNFSTNARTSRPPIVSTQDLLSLPGTR
ncbi:MAG: hypothetical protein PX638_19910, partial [Microcystis sp. M53599_WE4]|nr:hypothetical protein [Microcystis sp. M53599_WE4]